MLLRLRVFNKVLGLVGVLGFLMFLGSIGLWEAGEASFISAIIRGIIGFTLLSSSVRMYFFLNPHLR